MYKVAIFEDEIVIRKALISQIDWESLECVIVAETSNGNEGMRIIDDLAPDLIISDIRLHGCEALEICKYINEKGYETEVILMTGYAKMDYAKAAIKSGVRDFILKPIDPNELIEAVKKCVSDLKKKEVLASEISELKAIGKNELPKLRENFFRELYNNVMTDPDNIRKRSRFLNLALTKYRCLAMDIDINNDVPDTMITRQNELLYRIKESIVEEYPHDEIYTCMWREKVYAIVNDSSVALAEFVSDFQKTVYQTLHLSISAGISSPYEDTIHLGRGLIEAEQALGQKFHQGNGSIIWADVMNQLPRNEVGSNIQMMNQYMMIADYVIAGKSMDAKKCFMDFWQTLTEINNEFVLRNKATELLVVLAYHLKNKDIDIEQLIPLNLMHERIKKLSDLHSIYMLLSNLIYLVAKQREEELEARSTNVIECIKDYIDQNYANNISLSDLADKVFLSEKYLSTLVKKETGQTITDLITEKRIAVAKELLRGNELKTYEVADQIGITDARYFSQLFKKHTGYTPSQYRRYKN